MNLSHSNGYQEGDIIRIEEEEGQATTVEVVEYADQLFYVSLLADEKRAAALPVVRVKFKKEHKMYPGKTFDEARMVLGVFLKNEGSDLHLERWDAICRKYKAVCIEISFTRKQ